MTVKQVLQGDWLGHPLHPAMVHLPVGLWTAALVFDLLSRISSESPRQSGAMAVVSFWAIAVGIIAALAAIPTGLADWWEIKRGKPAYALGIWHMSLNAVAFTLFAINLVWRFSDGMGSAPVGTGPLLLSAAGVIVLGAAGFLGGRMVFEHGVGIARKSKQKWRSLAGAGGARLPPEDDKAGGGSA